jgi:formylglycine-generating enzyme required for sulfatase activity
MKEAGAKPQAGDCCKIVLPNGAAMTFRLILAGEFRMGQRGEYEDEEPQHRVVIPDDFWMGETPVTQAQFAAWKPEHENSFKNRPDNPAEDVTWHEAREYCRWLTAECATNFPAGEWTADLPDEARWEYACRAGTETDYYSGDGEAALAEVAWYDGNSGNETNPVRAKKAPNAWGLHDMHGNVWEWCADVWDARAYRKRKCEQVDGDDRVWWAARAWTVEDAGQDAEYWTDEDRKQESPDRVLRGGAWNYSARGCRSAIRWLWPSVRVGRDGFRVCLARSSPAEESKREAEPAPGGVARRDDEAKPDGAGGAERGKIDLARERLPEKPE